MNSRLALIRQRRRLLHLTAEAQRQALAEFGARWRAPLALADAGAAALRGLHRHPLVLALLVVLLVQLRRSGPRRWARVAIGIWQGYRALSALR